MKNVYDISDYVTVTTVQSVRINLVQRFKKRRKEYGISQKNLATR